MGSILRCPHPLKEGVVRHVFVLLPLRVKDGVCIILLEFIPLHNAILLKALLYSLELNTLDAGRSHSMCGVIVVDAESFRSTCCGRDAYIHDHA